ncbi:hypothetical protein K435DRAFT_960639 [Dendrothele bispora CBS 962.96]|uniref:Uncharacterized protein n=1 Tax=Dendrothele bispora (strain CBS 962.96) TaxID=1314807 RepID=A0A4S8MT97_DENBC|nr:hypothetical protein K435DRAFT_960639 [Dendrothele bispora CBS 962.96]
MAPSPSPGTISLNNLLDSPVDIILEIAHHLLVLEPQVVGGEHISSAHSRHPRLRPNHRTQKSSLMSLASCNSSLYNLISPLVFRKLVFVQTPGSNKISLMEMCKMLANVSSYTPPWLKHVKEAHFVGWYGWALSDVRLDPETIDVYARSLGRFIKLEKMYFSYCNDIEGIWSVIGNEVFPKHISIIESPFDPQCLAQSWSKITARLEDRNEEVNDRTLEILTRKADPEDPGEDASSDVIYTLGTTPRIACSLVSLSLGHIHDVPVFFKILRDSQLLRTLSIEGVICNNALLSMYDDPERELRELHLPPLPSTSLPNLTHLRIPPGFLPFFVKPLTQGKARHSLKHLDLMPYYVHGELDYIPVTNIPFDRLCNADGLSVTLPSVETLKMRIDRYMQWNLGEWFPNLKEMTLIDVSMASTGSFLKLLASHWPSPTFIPVNSNPDHTPIPPSSRTYTLESLCVTSRPRDSRNLRFFSAFRYQFSELDLKWQLEGALALSHEAVPLRQLRRFSCGDAVEWRREPGGPKVVQENDIGNSVTVAATVDVAEGDNTNTQVSDIDLTTRNDGEEDLRDGWALWKPHVNPYLKPVIKHELELMYQNEFTMLFSDYQGCWRGLFTDGDLRTNRLTMMMLVEYLEEHP